MSDIDIPGYGKLWVANKPGLPLLLVFGGIAVRPSQMDGIKRNKDEDKPVQSDVYMWNPSITFPPTLESASSACFRTLDTKRVITTEVVTKTIIAT